MNIKINLLAIILLTSNGVRAAEALEGLSLSEGGASASLVSAAEIFEMYAFRSKTEFEADGVSRKRMPEVEIFAALQNCSDVKTLSDSGRSLLHYAAAEHHIPAVNYLLEQGLDPAAVDTKGQTVLARCLLGTKNPSHVNELSDEKTFEVLNILLNALNKNEVTQKALIKLLGTPVMSGCTPLHFVMRKLVNLEAKFGMISYGNPACDIVRNLLHFGARLSDEDYDSYEEEFSKKDNVVAVFDTVREFIYPE